MTITNDTKAQLPYESFCIGRGLEIAQSVVILYCATTAGLENELQFPSVVGNKLKGEWSLVQVCFVTCCLTP